MDIFNGPRSRRVYVGTGHARCPAVEAELDDLTKSCRVASFALHTPVRLRDKLPSDPAHCPRDAPAMHRALQMRNHKELACKDYRKSNIVTIFAVKSWLPSDRSTLPIYRQRNIRIVLIHSCSPAMTTLPLAFSRACKICLCSRLTSRATQANECIESSLLFRRSKSLPQ